MARYTDQYKAKVDTGLGTAVELTAKNFPAELLAPHASKRQKRSRGLARLNQDSEEENDEDDEDGPEAVVEEDDESDDNDYNMGGDVEDGNDSDVDDAVNE